MPTFCFACETLLDEHDTISSGNPCPKCGHTSIVRYEKGQEFSLKAGGFEIRSKPKEGGRWFCRGTIKHSYYKKDNENHFIERSINRDSNEYYERIMKKDTGEVVREVSEPLTEHQGRGSAKKPKNGK